MLLVRWGLTDHCKVPISIFIWKSRTITLSFFAHFLHAGCGCNTLGTLSGTLQCDQSTGVCPCKPTVQGGLCEECKDGFYNFPLSGQQECQQCPCDLGGAYPLCNKDIGGTGSCALVGCCGVLQQGDQPVNHTDCHSYSLIQSHIKFLSLPPSPPPPHAMLDDSSAILSLRTTLNRGRGERGRILAQGTFVSI